jgi:hypothetical protein
MIAFTSLVSQADNSFLLTADVPTLNRLDTDTMATIRGESLTLINTRSGKGKTGKLIETSAPAHGVTRVAELRCNLPNAGCSLNTTKARATVFVSKSQRTIKFNDDHPINLVLKP